MTSPSPLRAHLDQRPPAVFCGVEMTFVGWCFDEECGERPAVWAEATLQVLAGGEQDPFVYERAARPVPRPDVQAAFPDHPVPDRCGFVVTFPVPRNGLYDVSIKAAGLQGTGETIARCEIAAVAPHLVSEGAARVGEAWQGTGPDDFLFTLDRPTGGVLPAPPFQMSGWCARKDGQQILGMRAAFDDVAVPVIHGIARRDVHLASDERPGTLLCGFAATVEADVKGGSVVFEAMGPDGWVAVRTLPLAHPSPLRLTASALRRGASVLRQGAAAALAGRRGGLAEPGCLVRQWYFETLPSTVARMGWRVYGDFRQHAPRELVPERFPAPSGSPAETLPRFVIVTPSYNQAAWLEATMRSVLDQEGVRVDYIVMDGGSKDGSVEIIERYATRLAHWFSGKDGGQSAAIAAGLARADCGPDEVMAYLNSDDTLMPGALRFVAEYFARRPEVDAVFGHRVIIDAQGCETGRWFAHRHDPDLTLHVDLIPQETLFWRRRIYDRVGGIDPTFRFAMDWDLITRFIRAGARMARLPWFLGCFRWHDESKTATQSESVGAAEVERIRRAIHGRNISEVEVLQRWYRGVAQANAAAWLWRRGVRW